MPASSSSSLRQTSTAKSTLSGDESLHSARGKLPRYSKHAVSQAVDINPSNSVDTSVGALTEKVAEDGFTSIIRAQDRSTKHLYITGLRGIMVMESFVWTFFQTFIPTLISTHTKGPEYQDLLREMFSVPLWNITLIQNFFIILSMRTICVSFLQNPSGRTYGGAVIRRIIRLAITLSVASGISTLIFSQVGTDRVGDFQAQLPNDSIQRPELVHDGLAAVNSWFILFWVTKDFFSQAANLFWPTQTLWVLSLIYYQSFTVYFLMVILPFTRPKWHLTGLALFGLGSFWYGSWGWYSATGLFFASVALDETLQSELKRGMKIKNDQHLPYWVPAIVFGFIGVALKYAFTVRPQYVNKLLILHPFVDLSENTSLSQVATEPYARLDDWFMITAILIVVELFEPLQYLLSFKPLVWIGERSLSIYFMQCITFWTAGIDFWLFLYVRKGIDVPGANAIVLIVCLVAITVFSELFYRLIDLPSQWVAKYAWIFLVS